MKAVKGLAIGLVAITFAGAAMANLSSEWKQTIEGDSHFVHTPTVSYSKTPQGEKRVKLWTIVNIEPAVDRGKTYRSMKSEATINCDRRSISSIMYAYEASFARGAMVFGPVYNAEISIPPETSADLMWRKYCKSWKNWFK